MLGILVFLSVLPEFVVAQAYAYPNGSTVANFTVTDVQGNTHDLTNYTIQGKFVLLDFYTLDCLPCQQTAPYWAELFERHGCNTGDVVSLSLLGISYSLPEIALYADTYYGAWPHPPIVNDAATMWQMFQVGSAPTYCLIGPDNLMINSFIWPISSMADLLAAFPEGSTITPLSCAVGIDERNDQLLQAYPNPTNGTVHIPAMAGDGAVDVRDALGRRMDLRVEPALINGQHVLDLGHLTDGLYWVHVQGHTGGSRVHAVAKE
jgi:thiol-disulfide isomerase/thioredoxin